MIDVNGTNGCKELHSQDTVHSAVLQEVSMCLFPAVAECLQLLNGCLLIADRALRGRFRGGAQTVADNVAMVAGDRKSNKYPVAPLPRTQSIDDALVHSLLVRI